MMKRIGLAAVVTLLAGPAMALNLGENFGATSDYGIVHEGGAAIATIGKIVKADDAANGIAVDVKWDGDTAHWVDSFTVFCPGTQAVPGVVDNSGKGPNFDPTIEVAPMSGQLVLERELYVRTCQ